jgi:hypothetical protein
VLPSDWLKRHWDDCATDVTVNSNAALYYEQQRGPASGRAKGLTLEEFERQKKGDAFGEMEALLRQARRESGGQ